MPAARDLDDGDERTPGRGLADDRSRAVGFLDLADLDAAGVIAAVLAGFTQVDDDAVLTAYCNSIDRLAVPGLCRRSGLDLVHVVVHDVGMTLVLRRPRP